MTQHLTEEEFADYLLDLSSTATRAHLLECGDCRQEMESFGGSLVAFNQTSMEWSRGESASHPIRLEKTEARRSNRLPRPVWQAGWSAGLAVAAVLAFAVALPLMLTHERTISVPAAQVAIVSAPKAEIVAGGHVAADVQGIQEDNAMLAAIDAEISQPVASPLESLGAFRPSAATSRTSAEGTSASRKNN